MLIVDTSALVAAFTIPGANPRLLGRLSDDNDLHAPHLVDAEFVHAIRGLERARELSSDRANDVLRDWQKLAVTRYPHEPLIPRVWELRHNLSAYDAMFVALAEHTGIPLITCDARLAAAPGSKAAIELFD